MAEPVDARDLKSLGLARAGSIPAVRTMIWSYAVLLGFALWEWMMIAAGAILGAWLFRKYNS